MIPKYINADMVVAGPWLDRLIADVYNKESKIEHNKCYIQLPDQSWTEFSPSTDWLYGGPLMDDISIIFNGEKSEKLLRYKAFYYHYSNDNPTNCHGRTQLEAAMRCIVKCHQALP